MGAHNPGMPIAGIGEMNEVIVQSWAAINQNCWFRRDQVASHLGEMPPFGGTLSASALLNLDANHYCSLQLSSGNASSIAVITSS